MIAAKTRADSDEPALLTDSLPRVDFQGDRALSRSSFKDDEGPEYVVALLQGRGPVVEVGIAAISQQTGQVVDGPTFQRTIQHINLYSPTSILVPSTALPDARHGQDARASSMVEELEKNFPVSYKGVDRRFWDPDTGMSYGPPGRKRYLRELTGVGVARLQRLAIEDCAKAPMIMAVAERFYARCAVAAALEFMDPSRSRYTTASLRVQYVALDGTLFIDVATARNLELVKNALTRKSKNTLLSMLDHCKTPMGSRMLATDILQPSNNPDVINARLDTIQEFRQDEDYLEKTRRALEAIGKLDVEQILGSISQNAASPGPRLKNIGSQIDLLLDIRDVVACARQIDDTLKDAKSAMVRQQQEKLQDPGLRELEMIIKASLNEQASLGRAKRSSQEHRLYALESKDNHMLDIARATYKENDSDAQECCERLAGQGEAGIRISRSAGVYELYIEGHDTSLLEAGFTRFNRAKSRMLFSHPELIQRNERLKQSREEILILTETRIDEIFQDIRPHLNGLWNCVESIAFVDVLSSLAYGSLGQSFVRPAFGPKIFIRNGRHPILDRTLQGGSCVPNDTLLVNGLSNFQLIQGPNMSGKSTYLRQVGLLVIMAHMGCYVPAETAEFKLHDSVLGRLSNDDSMERSLSTFASEMATSAMILGMATSQSLILIDELGRGTSSQEGVGLSHAIAESLAERKSSVLFATHFQDLAQTLSTGPGIVNLHLQTGGRNLDPDTPEFGTTFLYKVVDGPCEIDHYGLQVAKLASLPIAVHDRAEEVAAQLTRLEFEGRRSTATYAVATRRKTVLDGAARLAALADSSVLHDATLLHKLRALQADTITKLRTTYQDI